MNREEERRRERVGRENETRGERDSKIREIEVRGLKRILTEDFSELTKWQVD